jgi:hypothetical protein
LLLAFSFGVLLWVYRLRNSSASIAAAAVDGAPRT